MKINKVYITGIACLIFAGWIALQTSQIPEKLVSNEPGPKLFPYISAAGIAICAVLSMIFDAKGDAAKSSKPYLTKSGWTRILIIFAELIIFAIGMKWLGFLLTGLIMMPIVIWTLKGEQKLNKLFAILLSVAFVLITYFGFTKGFIIPLPSGELWQILGIKLPF